MATDGITQGVRLYVLLLQLQLCTIKNTSHVAFLYKNPLKKTKLEATGKGGGALLLLFSSYESAVTFRQLVCYLIPTLQALLLQIVAL